MLRSVGLACAVGVLLSSAALQAATVADVVAAAKPSVVVVTYSDRDGEAAGIGTGFVVDAAGLIATNLHVIGEARPITVRFSDGTSHAVTAIEATDLASDLALLRIDAKGLASLPLGKSRELTEGQELVAIGHPRGLESSVVRGVLSGRRNIDSREFLQLAIPVEAGNSGGPVLDLDGEVVGMLTMKSAVTNNLGFAVPIESLQPLLDKPNPVPLERWLTIGRLDPKSWTPLFGGTWRQRAGQIDVGGPGEGFGGRTLLLSTRDVPDPPYEVAVMVKLNDESGAAGLVFGSDGDQRHLGFYPSNGALRFTRFDGTDVFSWQVLEQIPSRAYHSGEWNTLKVRVEEGRVIAFVNEVEILDWKGETREGKVGLAAFRGTKAAFKRFQLAEELADEKISEDASEELREKIASLDLDRPPRSAEIEAVQDASPFAPNALEVEAQRLERRATRVRQLAAGVRQRVVLNEFEAAIKSDPPELLRAALLIAKLDNFEVDVDAYVESTRQLAEEAQQGLPKDAAEADRLAALDQLLFEQLGFHGSRTNYYSRSNSYLNEVIDDREGLPVALSVLYIELARELGLKVEGVGLPGHFVVRFVPSAGEPQLIDVFDRGTRLSREQAEAVAGSTLDDRAFVALTEIEILDRMLRNLIGLAQSSEDAEAMLRYVNAALVLKPDSGGDRLLRVLVCVNTDRFDEALADCDRLLEDSPEGIDLHRVAELRNLVAQRKRAAALGNASE